MASNRQRMSDSAEGREKLPPVSGNVSDDSLTEVEDKKPSAVVTAIPKLEGVGQHKEARVSCVKRRSLGFWTCQICVVYLVWMFLSPFIYYFIFERATSLSRKSDARLSDANFVVPSTSQAPSDLSNIYWFSHTTDLHMSDDLLEDVAETTHHRAIFRSQQLLFHPAFFLVTGDLTNGLDEVGHGGGYQKPAEWNKYKTMLTELGIYDPQYYIDIPGNHDNYVVPHFTHSGNLYAKKSVTGPLLVASAPDQVTHGQLHYRKYSTKDQFPVFSVDFQPSGAPQPIPPVYMMFMDSNAKPGYQYRLNMFGAIRKQQVDTVKKVFKSSTPLGSNVFGVTHAPFEMSRDSYAFLDPLYEDMSSGTGMSGHVCGHTHVLGQVHRVGHGSTVSYTGGSVYSHSQFRLMFVDHGLVSILDADYEDITKESHALGLVTFPKPAGLLSEGEPWEHMSTDILRAVVFGWGPDAQFADMEFSFVVDKETITLGGADCAEITTGDLKFDTVPVPAGEAGDPTNGWMAICKGTYDHTKYKNGIHDVRIEAKHTPSDKVLVKTTHRFSLDGSVEGNWFDVDENRPWRTSDFGPFLSFFLGQAPEHNWSYYAIVIAFIILFVYPMNGFLITRYKRAFVKKSGKNVLDSPAKKGVRRHINSPEVSEMTVHVDQESSVGVNARESGSKRISSGESYQNEETPRLEDSDDNAVSPGTKASLMNHRQKTPVTTSAADRYQITPLSLRYGYILVILIFIIPYGFGPLLGEYSWGTYTWWGTVTKDFGPDGGLELGYDGYQGMSLIAATGLLLVPYFVIMRSLESSGRAKGWLHSRKMFSKYLIAPGVWIAFGLPVIICLVLGKIFFTSNVFSEVWGPAGYLLSPGFFAIPVANAIIEMREIIRYRRECTVLAKKK